MVQEHLTGTFRWAPPPRACPEDSFSCKPLPCTWPLLDQKDISAR